MSNKIIGDVLFKRGGTNKCNGHAGPNGTLAIDVDEKTFRLQDGQKLGGTHMSLTRAAGSKHIGDTTSGELLTTDTLPSASGNAPGHNHLINGNFDIWQRGNVHSSNGYGSADRWRLELAGATGTLRRVGVSDDPTTDLHAENYAKVTAGSPTEPSDYCALSQRVEGVGSLSGTAATLSFYARSSAPRQVAITLEQFFGSGDGASPSDMSVGGQLNLTETWERHIVTVDVPAIVDKVRAGEDDYLAVTLWLSAGADFHEQLGAVSDAAGDVDISRVKLERGDRASDFAYPMPGEELRRCRRYYERGPAWGRKDMYDDASGAVFMQVSKRVSPTIVIINPVTGAESGARITRYEGGSFNHPRMKINQGMPGLDEPVATDRFTMYHSNADGGPSTIADDNPYTNDYTINAIFTADAEL